MALCLSRTILPVPRTPECWEALRAPTIMKTPIAITLIIVGGLLILAPALTDYLARGQIVSTMSETKLTSLNLNPPPMSSAYRLGCYFAGCAMIAVAVIMSRPRRGDLKEG